MLPRLKIGLLAAFLILAGCAETEFATHVAKNVPPPPKSQGTFKVGNPYKIEGKWYRPQESYAHEETGIASWYGPGFHNKRTANGEKFDKNELTAAHRTLQMPSLVRVTNLDNGKSLVVRVNDRGPFSKGRVLDVSEKAAELLGFKNQGTAKVKIQVLKQESIKLAAAAKQGIDTGGYEVAVNSHANAGFHPVAAAAPVAPVQVGDLVPPTGIQGHSKDGRFYPDHVVKQMPVKPTTIYVQVGSFADMANADRLSDKLSAHGTARVMAAVVGGQQFYRVRIPASNVASADAILKSVMKHGYPKAIIVVD